jgi:hypothetical protein
MGWISSMVIVMMKPESWAAICGVCFLTGPGTAVGGENIRTGLPPLAAGSEAVRSVFDVKTVRPLDSSSFEGLRKYFSVRQQKNVDQFLDALTNLIATRNRVANRLGIKQEWWWPPDIGTDVHIVMKNDPLTDRAATPDKVSLTPSRLVDLKLIIEIKERYKEVARDGTNLGGTKLARVTLIPEGGRWVIDDITFTVHQYGKTNVTTLVQILAEDTKQLRNAQQNIANRKFEIRTARPASSVGRE